MSFLNPSGHYAAVVTCGDRAYSVSRFNAVADFTSCQPPEQTYQLRGTPNQQQILAVLPDGFTYTDDGDSLPLAPSPPPSITAWQIRRWLLGNGITLAAVDAVIAAIPDATQREAVRVDWEYAPYIERSHPMLPVLAAALGVEDLDAAFIEAEQIG